MNKTTFPFYLKSRVAYYKDHYSLKVGTAFGMWYAIESVGLEEDEAFEAVSFDGGNDKDIDFFLIDAPTERILIGQLKYKSTGKYAARKAELLSLLHTTDWLKDPEALRRDGRKDLANAADEYLTAVGNGYSVEYLYVYMGERRVDVEDVARQFNVSEAGSVPSRSCRVVDFSSLLSEHEERIDQSTRINKTTIQIQPNRYFEEDGAFGKALVTSLGGNELRTLHDTHGDRLFDRNVRLFLGARKGGVNAGLRDTLASTAERKNFWAYNNGITFICDNYELDQDDMLTLHNFSVVNGCQTTVSFTNSTVSAAKNARVLARFIAAPEKDIDSIIRFNNSQNPIRIWDLSSQDKLQKHLKKELAKLPQPFLYILRKGETRGMTNAEKKSFRRSGKPQGKLCVIQHDLNAQYLAAFRGLPAIAYKDKGKIFAGHYDEVYPSQIRAEEVVLAWQAGSIATAVVKEALEQAVADDDEQRVAILKRGGKFFVLAAMGLILHERNGKTFLNKLKPAVATSKATEARLKNYAAIAMEWYVIAATDLINAGQEITTIVRSPENWKSISQKIKSNWNVYKLSKKVMEEALPKL